MGKNYVPLIRQTSLIFFYVIPVPQTRLSQIYFKTDTERYQYFMHLNVDTFTGVPGEGYIYTLVSRAETLPQRYQISPGWSQIM